MPYSIRSQGNQKCVYNKNTGKTVPGGCHPTMGKAQKHLAALEANVDDAKEKKSKGKKVDSSNTTRKYNSTDNQRAAAKKGIDYRWKGR